MALNIRNEPHLTTTTKKSHNLRALYFVGRYFTWQDKILGNILAPCDEYYVT